MRGPLSYPWKSSTRPVVSFKAANPHGHNTILTHDQWQSVLLAFGCGGELQFREQFFIELGIHYDLIDSYFFRRNRSIPAERGPGHRESSRLQNKRDPKTIHGTIVAIINFHGMVCAIEAAWLSFNFGFEEGLRVNPYVECMPGLLNDLELIGIAPLHLFYAVQLDAAALSGVIHQGTIKVGLRRGNLQFLG